MEFYLAGLMAIFAGLLVAVACNVPSSVERGVAFGGATVFVLLSMLFGIDNATFAIEDSLHTSNTQQHTITQYQEMIFEKLEQMSNK